MHANQCFWRLLVYMNKQTYIHIYLRIVDKKKVRCR